MHSYIFDFQLYSQHDEELLGNYPLHFTTFFFLQLWTIPSVLHSWIFCLRTTSDGAMQRLEGIDWSWEISRCQCFLKLKKNVQRDFLLLTKEVRDPLVKYYNNPFPFLFLLYFPLSLWFSSTLRLLKTISVKEAIRKHCLFPLPHRRTDWETLSEGPSSSCPLLALPSSLPGLSSHHPGLPSQFNVLTQQLASQSCHCFCFLPSGRSMAVHGQVWWSPEPAQDNWWECMAMSRVASGRGRWEIPHWTACGSSADPQNHMLKMVQVSQRIWTRDTGSIQFCWIKFPYVVKGSNSAMSPKEEPRAPTSTCSANTAMGSWGLERKKKITADWQ